jgi:hypothetical protein
MSRYPDRPSTSHSSRGKGIATLRRVGGGRSLDARAAAAACTSAVRAVLVGGADPELAPSYVWPSDEVLEAEARLLSEEAPATPYTPGGTAAKESSPCRKHMVNALG